jgi:hypothetical protein
MPEFVVAIDHITYYAVRAEDEVTAIDLALEGQGLEIDSDIRDAYISEYEGIDPRKCQKSREGAMQDEAQIEPLTGEYPL